MSSTAHRGISIHKLGKLASLAVVVFVALAHQAAALDILLIGANDDGPLAGSDAYLASWLTSQGHTYTYMSDDGDGTFPTGAGFDAVVIPSSVNSGRVKTNFDLSDSPVGILHWEVALHDSTDADDFYMSLNNPEVANEVRLTGGVDSFDIRLNSNGHPIQGPIPNGGRIQFLGELSSDEGTLNTSSVFHSTENAAGVNDLASGVIDNSQMFIQYVDNGGALWGNGEPGSPATAPGRRVFFGLDNENFDNLSAAGLYLFDNALEWVAGQTVVHGAYVVADRDTGSLTLVNPASGASINVLGYEVQSVSGSLDPTNWLTIADNYDASGSGTPQLDADDEWTLISTEASDIAEYQIDFGGSGANDGGFLAPGQSLSLATSGGWIPSLQRFEDLQMEISVLIGGDGEVLDLPIVYTGALNYPELADISGPAGTPDGTIDAVFDWVQLRSHFGADLSGLSPAAAYLQGDLDGDLDVDFGDYKIFRDTYEAIYGPGSFASAIAIQVPEPSSYLLCSMVLAGILAARSRKHVRILALVGTLAVWSAASTSSYALTAYTGFEGEPGDLGFTPAGAAGAVSITTDNPNTGANGLDLVAGVLNSGVDTASATFDTVDLTGVSYKYVSVMMKVADTSWEVDDSVDITVNHNGTGSPLNVFHGTYLEFEADEDPNGPDLENQGYVRYLAPLPDDATSATLVLSAVATQPSEVFSFDDITFGTMFDLPHVAVNTVSGSVRIVNPSGGSEITLSGYEFRSPASRLLDSWSGLTVSAAGDAVDGAEDLDSIPGNSPGESWERVETSNSSYLSELFLSASSTIPVGGSLSLGTAYNVGVEDPDLNFVYYNFANDAEVALPVLFTINTTLQGDFNDDGVVNLADYTLWRNNLGAASDSVINDAGDGSPGVTAGDYDIWKSNFGQSSVAVAGLSTSTNVPEPCTWMLALLAMLGLAYQRRLRPTWKVALLFALFAMVANGYCGAAYQVDRYYTMGDTSGEGTGGVVQDGNVVDSVSIEGIDVYDDNNFNGFADLDQTGDPVYHQITATDLSQGHPGPQGTFGIRFDGVDDYLAADDQFNVVRNGVSQGLQVWVYPRQAGLTSSSAQLIVFDSTNAGGPSITADGMWSQFSGGTPDVGGTVPVVGDQWHHVAQHVYFSADHAYQPLAQGPRSTSGLVRDFTSVMWVNGIAVSANASNSSSSQDFQVGGRDGDSRFFDGVLDELVVYSNTANEFNFLTDNDFVASFLESAPGGYQFGDINLDGSVDSSDSQKLVDHWLERKTFTGTGMEVTAGDLETYRWGDLNIDGRVDMRDALLLDQEIGSSATLALLYGGTTVPEPSSIAMIVVASTVIGVRFRGQPSEG